MNELNILLKHRVSHGAPDVGVAMVMKFANQRAILPEMKNIATHQSERH